VTDDGGDNNAYISDKTSKQELHMRKI